MLDLRQSYLQMTQRFVEVGEEEVLHALSASRLNSRGEGPRFRCRCLVVSRWQRRQRLIRSCSRLVVRAQV